MNTGLNTIHINPNFIPKCQPKINPNFIPKCQPKINPNFIPKCQPKIHLNPTFVNPKKLDNYLNSDSDTFVPTSVYENGMESMDGFYTTNQSSYSVDNAAVKNFSAKYQDYSDQYSDPSNLYTMYVSDSFHNTVNQPIHSEGVHAKSRNYVSDDYLKYLDFTGNIISNSISEKSLNHQISETPKAISKSVIMGQRMIKNQHIFPSKSIYSVDYRAPKSSQFVLKNSTSAFIRANHLVSQHSVNLLQNECVKEKSTSTYDKVQILQKLSCASPTASAYSVNAKNTCYSSAKGLSSMDLCKTSSKLIVSNVYDMPKSDLDKLPCKSNVSVLYGSTNTPTSPTSPTFESRTTFFKSSMKLIRSDTLRKSAKFIREDILVKKRRYAVKTKTKLVRQNSLNAKYPKFVLTPKLSKLRKSFKLKKGTLLRAREKLLSSRYSRPFTISPANKKQSLFKSKYKFVKDGILVSRYKVNRNPQPKTIISPPPAKNNRLTWSQKLKRNVKKSDKFININGSLYKSTATTLKKHDVSPKLKKKMKFSSPKGKRTKFSFRNSKFVYRRQSSTKLESGTLIEIVRRKKLAHFKRINEFCFFYNKYGKCKKQNKGCPFVHDPSKIAICTRFLQGSCTKTDCSFSHIMDKSKMPLCLHFQDGLCSKEDCPYRHVRVNPKAPVCKNFLKGHCPQGEECKKKHILICEDFNKDGTCPRGKKCPLSHRKPKDKIFKKSKLNVGTSKRRKQKAKSGKKVGILGLICSEKTVVKNCKTPSISNRYFDCSDDELETASEHSNCSTNRDTGSVAYEQKRERLFRKLEALKRNYHVGVEKSVENQDDMENELKLAPRERLVSSIIENNDDVSSQESSSFKLNYIPLPDVMPSFIPLVMPEHKL